MSFLARQLDDRTRVARIRRGCYVVLVVIALAEIVLPRLFPGGEHLHNQYIAHQGVLNFQGAINPYYRGQINELQEECLYSCNAQIDDGYGSAEFV